MVYYFSGFEGYPGGSSAGFTWAHWYDYIQLEDRLGWNVQDGLTYMFATWCWFLGGVSHFSSTWPFILQ